MKTQSIRRNLLAGLGLLMACLFGGQAFAGDVDLLPVNPVSPATAPSPKKATRPKPAATRPSTTAGSGGAVDSVPAFNGEGTIDQINANGYVINDTTFILAPDVKFRLSASQSTPRSSFKLGTYVAYFLDNQRRITELWLWKKK